MSTPSFTHLSALPWDAQDLSPEQLGLGTVFPVRLGLPLSHALYRQPRRWQFRCKINITFRGQTAVVETSNLPANEDRAEQAWHLCFPTSTGFSASTGGQVNDWSYGVTMSFSHSATSARSIEEDTSLSNVWPSFVFAIGVSVGDEFSGGETWFGEFTTLRSDVQGGVYGHLEFPDTDKQIDLGGLIEHAGGAMGDAPSVNGDAWLSWLRWEFDNSPLP